MIGDRCLRVAHHAFILLLVVASAVVLSAQTVVDPRYVEFAPSADHNTNASDGTPLVQRYSLSVYVAGSSVAFDTMDLGKPTPSGGVIRVDFLPLLHSVPTPGVVFEARVTAVGPGGSTASSLSNGFSFHAACAPTINSTGQSVGSGGGTGSVGVTAGSGCSWSAASNAGWITLTGATGGTGNGSVPFSVAANTGSARTGTLTVAGRTYTVNQAALSCSYTVSPTSQAMPVGGGPGLTDVTAPAGCAWTAASNNTGWLTVTSGASGSGNGTVAFSTTANPNGSARNGTLTVAGQTFTVTQSGAGCTLAISSNSWSAPAAGGAASTNVTAGAGCPWSAASNNTWIAVTSGASGSGNGTVRLSVTANPNPWGRSGTLTIATQTFTVSQAASACTYSLNPTSRNIASTAVTTTTAVTTGAGCVWTAVSNATGWLSFNGSATGTGTGTVSLRATANTTAQARVGTVAISGQTLTVTQAASACSYVLTPANRTIGGDGGTGNITVGAGSGCSWTATTTQSWISVSGSGTAAGSVSYTVLRNTSATQRTGSISIGTQAFTITQSAATNTPAAPSGLRIAVTGGSQ